MGGVAAVASLVYGVYSGMEAADAQEEAARDAESLAQQNARNIEAEGAREKQLTREAQEVSEAQGRARAAASGTKDTGSQQIFKSDVEKKHKEALDWMGTATKSQADITRRGGTSAKKQGYAQASATRGSAIASGLGSLGPAGKKAGWWS